MTTPENANTLVNFDSGLSAFVLVGMGDGFFAIGYYYWSIAQPLW